ncbi:MAG TPA: DJ-1/PfpI family protein [Alphaproteobacteria bacterium]|jgi:transcriptional regulator GlxA family with amidase domain|nr:DJ-1/PfpI family protein [Alphaproteobacteria bacterium]
MKIAIFLFDGVTALDAVGPYESLSRLPTTEIVFVGKAIGPVRTGNRFLALNADRAISDMTDADIVIVPGGLGDGLTAIVSDAETRDWLRDIDRRTIWTCAVCTGSLVLGAAGLLRGRRGATHWRARNALDQFGAEYCNDRVVFDDKYVTSAGVSAGLDMGLELCERIAGRELAEAVELSMQYDPKPPFGTGRFEDATPERIGLVENTLRK